jgi:hypothetical protein
MLAYLRKMTLDPDGLGPDDARVLLSKGLSRDAIHEAMYVAYLFNIYDRLADTLGWHLPPEAQYEKQADHLLKRGYL